MSSRHPTNRKAEDRLSGKPKLVEYRTPAGATEEEVERALEALTERQERTSSRGAMLHEEIFGAPPWGGLRVVPSNDGEEADTTTRAPWRPTSQAPRPRASLRPSAAPGRESRPSAEAVARIAAAIDLELRKERAITSTRAAEPVIPAPPRLPTMRWSVRPAAAPERSAGRLLKAYGGGLLAAGTLCAGVLLAVFAAWRTQPTPAVEPAAPTLVEVAASAPVEVAVPASVESLASASMEVPAQPSVDEPQLGLAAAACGTAGAAEALATVAPAEVAAPPQPIAARPAAPVLRAPPAPAPAAVPTPVPTPIPLTGPLLKED